MFLTCYAHSNNLRHLSAESCFGMSCKGSSCVKTKAVPDHVPDSSVQFEQLFYPMGTIMIDDDASFAIV